MKYFKVVDYINSEVVIDTRKTNYSLTLKHKSKYPNLLNFIIQSSDELDLPLDFYFSLNNHLAKSGNLYLKNLPASVNGIFDISILTTNQNHKGIYIKEDDLIKIVESLDAIGISEFQEGFYLWENIYEKIRLNNYQDKPNRDQSFFLFDNIKDCQYYIDNHKRGGVICEIEILNTHSLFKADMYLLDTIQNNFTFKQVKQQVHNYWSGNISNHPVFEYLFQGKCKLKPI